MKRKINLLAMLFISMAMFAQSGFQQNGSSLYYNGGNVGIGTSTPTQKLEVKGRVAIFPTGVSTDFGYNGNLIVTKPTESGQYINLVRHGIYPWSIGTVYNSNTFAIGTGKENDSQFTNPYLSINTNGYVGIGVANPQYKLDINGNTRTTDLLLDGKIGRILDDTFTYNNHIMGHYSQTWVADPENISGYTLWLSSYKGIKFFTSGKLRFTVHSEGNIGIGTSNPTAKLDVIGDIRAYEVKVCLNQGCDFVFEDNYDLMPLDELEEFINTKKHLPDIAPAVVMESEGISISEMNMKLLQKVEEQTLYIIELNKQIGEIRKELYEVKKINEF